MKKNVFGSEKERNYYHKLSRLWSEQFRIYHNLPFLQIFTADNLYEFSGDTFQPLILTSKDFDALKKTSVDFTLCDDSDAPLLCIEFDGLQHGFNVGSKYHTPQAKHRQDQKRQYMMDLKLKVAHGSFFPFFVVYSSLFDDIDAEIKLTIVDGIIGDWIAKQATREQLDEGSVAEYYSYSEDEFANLDPDTRQQLAQDYVLDIEVGADLEHNPVWQTSAQLGREVREYLTGHSVRYITLPDNHSKSIQERIKHLRTVTHFGTKVTIHTKQYGEIESQVMIPNFDGITGWGGLTEEIALIMAFSKLKRLIGKDTQETRVE